MSYQNVATPRFYVDKMQWWASAPRYIHRYHTPEDALSMVNYTNNVRAFGATLGIYPDRVVYGGAPHVENTTSYACSLGSFNTDVDGVLQSMILPRGISLNFAAILGHNGYTTISGEMEFWYYDSGNSSNSNTAEIGFTFANIVNWSGSAGYFNPVHNGYSIAKLSGGLLNPKRTFVFAGIKDDQWNPSAPDLHTGSFLLGEYFDMPHSPELSLTMSHEYDGVIKQETPGGANLVGNVYYKPPNWGQLPAWSLDGWDRVYSGRRSWELSFSHLSDDDLEPYHFATTVLTEPDGSGTSHPDRKDNWFSNVLYYTNGGHLPFIFCPDPSIVYDYDTRTVPEFAVCKFDMNTFKKEQVANGVYNMKIKIIESW